MKDSRVSLSPLFPGGEGGVRTLDRLIVSVSYRWHVASDAKIAIHAVDHCTLLHAGNSGRSRFMNVSHVTDGEFSLGSRVMRFGAGSLGG